MNGWLGFDGILSTQVAAISCLRKCIRDYAFRMNVMEEIFEIRSCREILTNDIKMTEKISEGRDCYQHQWTHRDSLHCFLCAGASS